jgi:predicted acylesterase/phospholipase RssA
MPSSSTRRVAALLVMAGLLLQPRAATAAALDARSPASSSLGDPISITVSGGVSLGAYEAGLLHYALIWVRDNAARAEVKQVTGASAGSVNSVLSMFAQCGAPKDAPSESLFWNVWVPLGLDQLFIPGKTSKQSAFSRAWFEQTADELEKRWDQGFRPSCDLVLGFSATRVVPRNVRVGNAEGTLTVPRIEERFLLRVQGRGPGKLPRLTNYTEKTGIGDPLLLPEDEKGEIPFRALRDLLFASTAFPVAFAPVELAHCVAVHEPGKVPRCPQATASRALFVDGGLFDNTPLALAVSNAAAGLRDTPDGGVRWLDRADASTSKLPSNVTFVYLETDVTAYQVARRSDVASSDPSLMDLLGNVTGAFLTTARSKNLYTLVEQMPGASERIRATARHFPAASSPMMAFLGFFEKEFRRYDFYLGMYDARRLITERFVPQTGRAAETFAFPEVRGAGSSDWRALVCLRALFDGDGDAAAVCAGDDLGDIRALAQVSLERLYEACRHPVAPQLPPITHAQCRAANEGGEPAIVPGVRPLPPGTSWRKDATESEIQWVVRLLSGHGFHFRDLAAERPEEALAKIRMRMGDVVEATAKQQPGWERPVIRRTGLMAANALLYVPYQNRLWVALGRELELGYGRSFTTAPGVWSRLKLDVGLQIPGIYTILSSDELVWGLLPFAGASFRLPGFESQAFQLNAVGHAGFLFSKGDDFNGKPCATNGRPIGSCSGWSIQGGLSAEALEVLFFRLLLEWYSPGSRWAVAPMIGVQLGF